MNRLGMEGYESWLKTCSDIFCYVFSPLQIWILLQSELLMGSLAVYLGHKTLHLLQQLEVIGGVKVQVVQGVLGGQVEQQQGGVVSLALEK